MYKQVQRRLQSCVRVLNQQIRLKLFVPSVQTPTLRITAQSFPVPQLLQQQQTSSPSRQTPTPRRTAQSFLRIPTTNKQTNKNLIVPSRQTPTPRLTAQSFLLVLLLPALLVAAVVVVVIVLPVLAAVSGRPGHLVLLLQTTAGVGEPRGHLGQGHLGDDGQHDLLAFGRVRVLDVLVEPRLQGVRALPGGVLPASVEVQTAVPVNKETVNKATCVRS